MDTTLGPLGRLYLADNGNFRIRRIAPLNVAFSDDPVIARQTTIRASHVRELRDATDMLRGFVGLVSFAYSTPNPSERASVIRASDITELRVAISEAYEAAGVVPATYSDPQLMAGATVRSFHVNELRAAIRSLANTVTTSGAL